VSSGSGWNFGKNGRPWPPRVWGGGGPEKEKGEGRKNRKGVHHLRAERRTIWGDWNKEEGGKGGPVYFLGKHPRESRFREEAFTNGRSELKGGKGGKPGNGGVSGGRVKDKDFPKNERIGESGDRNRRRNGILAASLGLWQ